MAVKKGDTISLHYAIEMENGDVFDSSVSRDPIKFEVGSGQVIPGIEEEVIGMSVGDKKKINVNPEKGFGEHKGDLIQSAPREIFKGHEVKAGDIVDLRSQEGELAKAQIVNVEEEQVTFDLNHPLAGKKIVVQIELVEVA